MNRQLIKIISCILATALLALSGCTSQPKDGQPGAKGEGATGRYMEQQLTLPENTGHIMYLDQEANGDFVLIANTTPDAAMGPYDLYRSTDGGESWTREDTPWLDAVGEYQIINGVAPAPGGGYYLLLTQVDPEALARYREDPDSFDDEDYREDVVLYRSDETSIVPLPFEAPMLNQYGYDMAPIGLDALENGDLLLFYYDTMLQADAATGAGKQEYVFNDGMLTDGTYAASGTTLALFDGNRILEYDTATGALAGETTNANEEAGGAGTNVVIMDGGYGSAIDYAPGEDAYYFCDALGIYRTTIGGTVVERLLDGELSSLNMPTMYVRNLFVQDDGSFVVYGSNNRQPVLMRYYYDPDVPSAPSVELTVYSLQDNNDIRQAMGSFQLTHPEVRVNYKIGVPEDSGITASDAMRTLSTELIGGSGPDVLVLDGMPVDSYVQKGVLMDLEPVVGGKITSGELLGTVAGTFRQGDGLYAVPARFSVPMYLGPQDSVEAASNLTAFADWILAQDSPRLSYNDGSALLGQFYSLYQPLWFREDGTLNEDTLTRTLEDISRLTEVNALYAMSLEDIISIQRYSSVMSDAAMWGSGVITAGVGDFVGLDDAAYPSSAIEKVGSGVFVPMQNGEGGVYVPSTILGVNAGGAQTGLALEFVELVLSEEIQSISLGGIPVNTNSFAQTAINPNPEDYDGSYIGFAISSDDDGGNFESDLHVFWPGDSFMQAVMDEVTGVTTPSVDNLVVRQMILSESAGYFDGSRSAADTVSSIKQKVDLYLAEQG